MQKVLPQKLTAFLAAISVVIAVGIAIYMARPWGDNDAFHGVSDYLGLLALLLWVCSPLIYIFLASGKGSAAMPVVISRFAAALLVCIGGVAMLVDAAFIHPDAQGGLVFIVLPIYQWIVIAIAEATGRLAARWQAR